MKNTITITAALCILLLAGCEQRKSETKESVLDLYVFRDAGTGCEYVGASHNSITPRMGQDGKQVCGKAQP